MCKECPILKEAGVKMPKIVSESCDCWLRKYCFKTIPGKVYPNELVCKECILDDGTGEEID